MAEIKLRSKYTTGFKSRYKASSCVSGNKKKKKISSKKQAPLPFTMMMVMEDAYRGKTKLVRVYS